MMPNITLPFGPMVSASSAKLSEATAEPGAPVAAAAALHFLAAQLAAQPTLWESAHRATFETQLGSLLDQLRPRQAHLVVLPATKLSGLATPTKMTPLELLGWPELPSAQAARALAGWRAFVNTAETQALPTALARFLWAARTHTAFVRYDWYSELVNVSAFLTS